LNLKKSPLKDLMPILLSSMKFRTRFTKLGLVLSTHTGLFSSGQSRPYVSLRRETDKRQTNESAVCQPDECDSSLIPLNNTIVVPGGRYREIYYWDSYWVLQGLLKSELYDYATDLIRNFMDFIRVCLL
jgi:neutral trehalase